MHGYIGYINIKQTSTISRCLIIFTIYNIFNIVITHIRKPLVTYSLFSTLILKIPECVVYKFGIRNAIAQSKTQMRRKLFIHSWMTCYYHSDTIFNFSLTIYYINYMRNSIKYFVIFKRPLH